MDPKYIPSLVRFAIVAIAVVVISLFAPSTVVTGALAALMIITIITSTIGNQE